VQSLFKKAGEHERNFAAFSGAVYNADKRITTCLKYNNAILLMKNDNIIDKEKAIGLLDEFISSTSSYSPWSDIAKNHRSRLCSEIGKNCNDIDTSDNTNYKKIVSVQIDDNTYITLSDSKERVIKQLKNYRIKERRILRGRDLKSVIIDDLGIELLTSDYIFAITIKKNSKLKIILNEKDISSSIKIGMDKQSIDQLLKNTSFIITTKGSNGLSTRYYQDLGISVGINSKTNAVEEVTISSIK
jgi:hypothetical protein